MERFHNDDEGYLKWLRTHSSNGFVLNCEPNPRASYLILHRASCHTVNGSPARGSGWTSAYQKICAETEAEILQWSERNACGFPTHCGSCY
jgi:hypothetical protein